MAHAAGGIDHALRYQVPSPPVHRHITPTALTALHEKLNDPQGFASYHQIRLWLAQEPQVTLVYSSVHDLVRYKLRAKPQRPRPSHAKKAQKLYLNSRAFTLWLDSFAAAFAQSLNMLVLDHGAGHKAKAVRWPANVVPIFLPP
jgi:hypothetical protein